MIEQPSLALPTRRTALLPLVLLVILGTSWGLHFPILKFAARSGLPYSGIAAATICGVALALLAISLARGRLPVFRPRTIRFTSSARSSAISCPISSLSSPPAASMPTL